MGQGDEEVQVSRIALEVEGSFLGLVRFNRPAQRNPIGWSTIKLLRRIFEELAEDESVRVIAVTGKGKAFSAGGDLKAYLELQRDEVKFMEFLEDFHGMVNYIQFQVPKPVIALINGVTGAGGTEVLLGVRFCVRRRIRANWRRASELWPDGRRRGLGQIAPAYQPESCERNPVYRHLL